MITVGVLGMEVVVVVVMGVCVTLLMGGDGWGHGGV